VAGRVGQPLHGRSPSAASCFKPQDAPGCRPEWRLSSSNPGCPSASRPGRGRNGVGFGLRYVRLRLNSRRAGRTSRTSTRRVAWAQAIDAPAGQSHRTRSPSSRADAFLLEKIANWASYEIVDHLLLLWPARWRRGYPGLRLVLVHGAGTAVLVVIAGRRDRS
jgi:hypothetical protein